MLTVNNCSVRIGKVSIVDDVNFDLRPGQWLMLAGPNGAGKTSLLKAIARSLKSSGNMLFDGQDIAKMPSRGLARSMAVLQQSHNLSYAFTVRELVALGRYAHQSAWSHQDLGGQQKIDEAIELCGLTALKNQNALTLSGGELQRAFLAQVFAQDTPLLLLDEPVSHLDLPYQQSIFDLIDQWLKTPGRAVLSVVHDLQLARKYGSHGLLMKQGKRLAFGPMDEVFTRDNLKQAFDMDVSAWFDGLHAAWADLQTLAD